MPINNIKLADLLDSKAALYNNKQFIETDPICIPHMFTKKADIEITGLFAAVFAWGQRPTIINKCKELIRRMDNAPHDFIINHTDKHLQQLIGFKHRTFNDTDLLYFVSFLKHWYSTHKTLETAFSKGLNKQDENIEHALNYFRRTFFSMEHVPQRTQKHVSSPKQNSACKRINMYLRWMIRHDRNGVDFGIWKNIKPAQLVCPIDVHVQRVALKLGLLQSTKSNWQAAIELTNNLKKFSPTDPVKYDFALFGLGVFEKN